MELLALDRAEVIHPHNQQPKLLPRTDPNVSWQKALEQRIVDIAVGMGTAKSFI
jgi:hypothetical protein